MSFPNRTLRTQLGPVLRDARAIEHPEREYGAERIMQTERIAVGCGLITPRASLIADWNITAGTFEILHQEEAWNTDHAQAHPVLELVSGPYLVYTFAPSYLDANGAQVAFSITAARCSLAMFGDPSLHASWQVQEPRQVVIAPLAEFAFFRFWLEVF